MSCQRPACLHSSAAAMCQLKVRYKYSQLSCNKQSRTASGATLPPSILHVLIGRDVQPTA